MNKTMTSTKYQEVAEEYGFEVGAFLAYCRNHGIRPEYCEAVVDDFEKSYIDYFSDPRYFFRSYLSERGDWVVLPDYVRDHIDWEQVFSKEFGHEFWKQDNYYFLNI